MTPATARTAPIATTTMAMVINIFMLPDDDLEGEGHGVSTMSPQTSLFPEDFNDKAFDQRACEARNQDEHIKNLLHAISSIAHLSL